MLFLFGEKVFFGWEKNLFRILIVYFCEVFQFEKIIRLYYFYLNINKQPMDCSWNEVVGHKSSSYQQW